jgi:hypothetical protein
MCATLASPYEAAGWPLHRHFVLPSAECRRLQVRRALAAPPAGAGGRLCGRYRRTARALPRAVQAFAGTAEGRADLAFSTHAGQRGARRARGPVA